MRHSPRFVSAVCVILGLFVGIPWALAAIAIPDAASPDGKYTLSAASTPDSGCRVDVNRKPGDKSLSQIILERYYEEDPRYSISALWKPDSSAVAINVKEGPNNTYCRVLAEDHGEWKEVTLPPKMIEAARKKGNTSEGKAQDYLTASEWLPGNKLKLSYRGNSGAEYGLVFTLNQKGTPHFEYLQTIDPTPGSAVKAK